MWHCSVVIVVFLWYYVNRCTEKMPGLTEEEERYQDFDPVFDSMSTENSSLTESKSPVRSTNKFKRLLSTGDIRHNSNEETKSQRKRSFSVKQIGPIFKRSNSVSIPKSCFEQGNGDLFSKSCPNTGKDNHPIMYGSVDPCDADVLVGEAHLKQANESIDHISKVSETTDSELPEKLYFGYTKRQFKVFISLVLLSLNDIMSYSAIAPFYPVVAANKGLNPTQVGIIFSSYSVFGMLASLVIGIVLVRVGAKFCVIAGMFWNAGALFCFGFLDHCDYTSFFVLSIASRSLMGFGSNTAFTAMFAIIFQEFNERAITVLSISEALVGVGGMLGPLIGGALYEAGGYITPFMVLGSVQLILLAMCWIVLPPVPVENQTASTWPGKLLTHSSALISFAAIVVIFTLNSFITVSMSEFLTVEFNMTPIKVGTVFLVSSIFYAGLSPMWGYFADRWRNSYLMEIGFVGVALGLMLLGPVFFVKQLFGWDHQKLWLLYIAGAINGSFVGATLMPTFNDMLLAARELNLQETVLAQYGLVSGLWNMGFSVGDIAGPTLGGLMVERMGFENTAGVMAAMCIFLFFCKLLQRFVRYKFHKVAPETVLPVEADETRPLLDDPEIQ
uniref:MFS-type transporter SLC18B1-like n=1 Tax=Phallusia mammillata TaxID=59560 RepID=A0A6F9DTC7_9ASCI|nr:MFS-type transporter SLC18B1-like [Phallusia mammillata]